MKERIAIVITIFRLGVPLGLVAALLPSSAAYGRDAEAMRTTGPESTVEANTDGTLGVSGNSQGGFLANYTNIFYGPSVKDPSSYLPNDAGQADKTRPVFMKNFLSAAYALNENWAVTATAYWLYRPVLGQALIMQDPFLRISDASVISTGWGLNLYSDLRVHAGVTQDSRDASFLTGFQNFDYLTFQPDNGRFIFALRASARYNVFGQGGFGTDQEYYLAPEVNFRMSPQWALNLLYEMGASHQHGDNINYVTNDGTDLEPGIEWDPTPNIIVNPYVTIQTGGKIDLESTSFGMFFTWTFL